jgi:hypothetical protein
MHSSWFPPMSFTFEQKREAVAQLQRLAAHGPLQVLHGQPREVFAITNSIGDVYRGFFELVGPPAPGNPSASKSQSKLLITGPRFAGIMEEALRSVSTLPLDP